MPDPRQRQRSQADPARRPRKAQESEQSKRPPRFMDLQIRMGIDVHAVRLPIKHFDVLVTYWMLGEETVILRSVFEGMERNIVLRGTEGGHVSVRPAEPDRKIATYNVFRAADLRKDWLSERGE